MRQSGYFLVNLKPVAATVCHDYSVLLVHLNPHRLKKPSLGIQASDLLALLRHVLGIRGHPLLSPLGVPVTVTKELGNEKSPRVEHLDPVVTPVNYDNGNTWS